MIYGGKCNKIKWGLFQDNYIVVEQKNKIVTLELNPGV